MGVVTPCDNIFRITLPTPGNNQDLATIQVNAGLTASTAYVYIVTDKYGREYTKAINTDADGNFELQIADFPVGLFNSYAGGFLLQVKKTLQDATAQLLKFCTTNYDTILVTFADMTGVTSSIIDCK